MSSIIQSQEGSAKIDLREPLSCLQCARPSQKINQDRHNRSTEPLEKFASCSAVIPVDDT